MQVKQVVLSYCCCILFFNAVSAQSVIFPFEGCLLSETNATISDITENVTRECRCGVIGDGIYCDGNSLYYEFSDELRNVFSQKNYTFSFYFLPQNMDNVQALFALITGCNRDSSIVIQYIPQTQEIDLQISKKIGSAWSVRGPLNQGLCWHHVVVTKDNFVYALYIDDEFIGSFTNNEEFPIGPLAKGYLGYSPCVDQGQSNVFRGVIDQFEVLDITQSGAEVRQKNLRPDQIISNDTTLILGESLQIISGPSCTITPIWIPSDGVSDINLAEPLITPQVSTTYTRTLEHSFCTMQDTIRINILELENLDCSQLLVPNVFSPNGDNINDLLQISNLYIVDELLQFRIFDRWGSIVYQNSGPQSYWDGTNTTGDSPIGMYSYQIIYTCGGEEYENQGAFSLMR